MRLLGDLAQARNDGVDLDRANATWSTSSFTSYQPATLAGGRAVGGPRMPELALLYLGLWATGQGVVPCAKVSGDPFEHAPSNVKLVYPVFTIIFNVFACFLYKRRS
jgi:hypothetical protein